MTKKQIIELIKKEIAWCKSNPENMPEEWRMGFYEGLKQAIRIIQANSKVESKSGGI